MIPFEEIDSRLKAIQKDRVWLAENTPYSQDYIRTVLAPKSKRRTDRVQQVLSAAIEKEAQQQETPLGSPPIPPDRITIEVSCDQMKRYEAAAKADGLSTREWALVELNRCAEKWAQSQVIRENSRFKPLEPIRYDSTMNDAPKNTPPTIESTDREAEA